MSDCGGGVEFSVSLTSGWQPCVARENTACRLRRSAMSTVRFGFPWPPMFPIEEVRGRFDAGRASWTLPRAPNTLLWLHDFSQECHRGLAAAATTGCSAPRAPRQASVAPDQYPQTPPPQTPPPEYPTAPAPPGRTAQGLDAVIDISAHTTYCDFRLVRASNILAVIHKASEGDFFADPLCAERRPQAEAAGLLWGTYHFGKGDSSGAQQAAFFLDSSRPGPRTLLALDLEPNEGDPSNSMTREQAEAFVQAVASATGRLPLVYVHPTWANGGAGITPELDPRALRPLGRRLPCIAYDPAGLGNERLAALAICQRRLCGSPRPRPQQNRPGPRPLRSQHVQRRRGCASPALECRRLIERNGVQGRRFELSETPSRGIL